MKKKGQMSTTMTDVHSAPKASTSEPMRVADVHREAEDVVSSAMLGQRRSATGVYESPRIIEKP